MDRSRRQVGFFYGVFFQAELARAMEKTP